MTRTIEVTYDGEVLRPTEALDIEPNTKVLVTIETGDDLPPQSFLDVARNTQLAGPADWAENLESYLYDGKTGN